VRGGIDVPVLFGSRATHLPSAMGGLAGRALVAGDVLRSGDLARFDVDWRLRASEWDDAAGRGVRVLPGPDDHPSLRAGLDLLLTSLFQVSPDSNRMGYRLRGPVLPVPPAAGLSTPTPMGTIQAPEGGAPILLMADRQTTGGYPRLAVVISADLGHVGQLRPGDEVRFVACTHEDARAALRARRAEIGA
jgi:antagonist of KipI